MGIIKKQSITNSIITYIGIGLGFITTIYLYPNFLEANEYGLTRLLLSVSFIFTQFAHLGMKNTAIRFFPYFENDEKQHNGFLFLTLTIPLAGFLFFLGVLFLFDDLLLSYYDRSSLFESYYWFLIPIVFGQLYFEVLNSYVRARLHSVPGSVISEIILRLFAIVLLLAFWFNWLSFREFMIGFVISYIIQPVLLLLFLFFKGELFLKPNFAYLKTSLVKRMANYGLFALLGGMTTLIVNNIDIIMLGSLSGLTETGIYAIAFYIGSVIIVPQRSIGKIAPSLVAKYIKEKKMGEVEKIYKSSSINQMIPGFLIFVGVVANIHNLNDILPAEYASASSVIVVIGISKLIDMSAGINGSIILNSKYYRFDLISMLFLILFSVGLNYWLIPLLGITGAAIATAASLFLYNLIKGIYVWIKFRMQPLSSKMLIVILLSLAILWGSLQIDRIGNLYFDIALRSLVIAVVYSAGILAFNISDEVNKLWADFRNKIH
ncbi:lipopolysaccharide biosynthesis protein [Gracilimonas mengyeensis]|uniref:Membrane protein involved in the export of O-antigen and teichoic acid n=1 Tax=Gracilimonas mengyeensis TaxID=1302730 RepID=A0A521EHC1_9BACT|nr:oligosaccharide flippase family protein [Gracilimonas mengyeensis]SMO83324.1 Membrane protein involved in the export of O-antigen and teichoic acid [Gracilimonas mengyeensis]